MSTRLRDAVVLSTFAPSIDGIARYADQMVAALARDGAKPTRLGLLGSRGGGDELVDPTHGMRFLRVLRHVPRGRTVLVMWHAHYLTPGRQLARLASVASMAVGFRMRRTIVLQHEPDDDLLSGVAGLRRIFRRVEERLRQTMWSGAAEIWFHSAQECEAFRRRYPKAAADVELNLIPHGLGFTPEITLSQAEARSRLGVPLHERMFLCLGFISPHKGVDRAIHAFEAATPAHSRLWIVGGAMRNDQETRDHIETLRAMAARTDNVEFMERFVDNVEFDIWLTAADYVVLAYRSAATSSVLPRAQLLGARVIASGAGGTLEQLRPRIDILAADDDGLARAFLDASRHSP